MREIMAEIQPTKHVLSPAEKMCIVKSHRYFLKEKEEKRAGTQRKVRERVAECLGFSKRTVSLVIAHWNKHHDPLFVAEPSSKPPSPLSYDNSLVTILRQIIYERNKQVLPITSAILVNEVEKQTGTNINTRTMRRALRL